MFPAAVKDEVRNVCRLFGMTTGGPRVRASFWLLDAPGSLREQSRRMPDGTGLGWFSLGDEPGLTDVLTGATSFDNAARKVRNKLRVVSSGSPTSLRAAFSSSSAHGWSCSAGSSRASPAFPASRPTTTSNTRTGSFGPLARGANLRLHP
jgi:hypothetical protein